MRRDRRGVALLITLGMVVLIAAMAISFHDQMAIRLAEAKMGALDAEATALARSGATLGKMLLKLDGRQYQWFHQGENGGAVEPGSDSEAKASNEVLDRVYKLLAATRKDGIPMEAGALAIDLVDENARINVNKATEQHLVNLFAAVGLKRAKKLELLGETVDEDISREAAASVLNWRGWRRPGGADDTYYQKQKPPYQMRNGPYELPEELMLVKDITPLCYYGTPEEAPAQPVAEGTEADAKPKDEEIDPRTGEKKKKKKVQGIGPLLTVWGDGKVNANNASRAVLKVVPGVMDSPAREQIVTEIIKRRPFRSASELQGVLGLAGPQLAAAAGAQLKVTTDVVRVRAVGIRGVRRRAVEVVLLRRNKDVRTVFYRED